MTTYTVLLVLIGRLEAATEIKQEAEAAKKFLINLYIAQNSAALLDYTFLKFCSNKWLIC